MPPKINEGKYQAKFICAQLSEGKPGPDGKCKEFLALTFHLPTEDVERVIRLYLTHAAMKYSAETLKKLGYNGDLGAPDISNTEQELVCWHEAYDRKDGSRDLAEKWDFSFNRRESAPLKEVAPDRRAELQKRIQDEMAKASAPVSNAATPSPIDSDLPF